MESLSQNTHQDMIDIVSRRLLKSGIKLEDPQIVARSLLSYYDFDLAKVLELAV